MRFLFPGGILSPRARRARVDPGGWRFCSDTRPIVADIRARSARALVGARRTDQRVGRCRWRRRSRPVRRFSRAREPFVSSGPRRLRDVAAATSFHGPRRDRWSLPTAN